MTQGLQIGRMGSMSSVEPIKFEKKVVKPNTKVNIKLQGPIYVTQILLLPLYSYETLITYGY